MRSGTNLPTGSGLPESFESSYWPGALPPVDLDPQGGRKMSTQFDGLNLNLGNLSRLSHAQTRSISAENFDGAKGKGGMATEGKGAEHARGLGQGWKISPSVRIL